MVNNYKKGNNTMGFIEKFTKKCPRHNYVDITALSNECFKSITNRDDKPTFIMKAPKISDLECVLDSPFDPNLIIDSGSLENVHIETMFNNLYVVAKKINRFTVESVFKPVVLDLRFSKLEDISNISLINSLKDVYILKSLSLEKEFHAHSNKNYDDEISRIIKSYTRQGNFGFTLNSKRFDITIPNHQKMIITSNPDFVKEKTGYDFNEINPTPLAQP
jgi:hypothetical protein